MLENRLSGESSPYLLQHRDNPVHWQPWDDAALSLAKAENRPILLSVGYAACHWCHVMAHESFENPEIADLMNRHFVNIKVDREERPDLDTIYQAALAMLGESGGWPLTMFLTPAGEPFWGGTYFPPSPRFGRPGFAQVLEGIAATYVGEADKVMKNVAALKDGLTRLAVNQSGVAVTPEAAIALGEDIARQFDPFEGGLGQAPKFPQPAILKFLWRCWRRSGAQPFRQAVELTLAKMCQGGIYDHLGGGFSRYSVDDRWLVPHFEKMLYDNSQMIQCLTWLWQETGNALYGLRVRETVAWVLREMIALDAAGRPSGAFAASLDADSEGEEGKFYVWSSAEIDHLLGDQAEAFKAAYDVTPEGNWEGKTILNRSRRPILEGAESEAALARSREVLLEARAQRIPPGWDDKVLADWNGLMITALAEAASVFDEPDWLAAAERAFAFVADTMERAGRLCHSWRRGRLAHPASLDDYAFMAEAGLALYEATGKTDYLTHAKSWAAVLERHYRDLAGGGYFFSADDTGDVIQRVKNAHDNATPNGNGVLLGVFARLWHLTGEDTWRARAEDLAGVFTGALDRGAIPFATLLSATEILMEADHVVIIGRRDDADCKALLQTLHRHCLPNRVLQVLAADENLPAGHPAAGKGQIAGKATAYLCRGTRCSLPVATPEDLAALLKAGPE